MSEGYRIALVGVQGTFVGNVLALFVFLQSVDAPWPNWVELRRLDVVDAFVSDGGSDALLALLQSCRDRRDARGQRLDIGEVCGVARSFHVVDVVARNSLQGSDGACRIVGHLVGLAARAGEKDEVTIGIESTATTL